VIETRHQLVLPAVGGAGAGEVSAWYHQTGEHVTGGQPVVAVDIDKVVVDVPAPADGVLTAVAQIGTEVQVGEVLGWIQAERGD
jgi:pyruvate/2-oxoglutarate dehydrogenase complex dihydrolipoamide acyltransferase (E2) component